MSRDGARTRTLGPGVRLLLLVLLLVGATGPGALAPRRLRADEPAPAAPPAAPPAAVPATDPLVVGTYPVAVEGVVDGDTLRVAGEPAIRVLGVDSEEVFKDARDRAAAAADFAAYAKAKRGAGATPVKYGTPAGEAAREFVRALLADVPRVRLERDEVGGHDFDGYGRRLAHVILLRPQDERNLAVELVRAGHAPHFVKYGRTRRFDAELAAAQREARAAKRGIWSTTGPAHYPDYEERLAWWEERALQVDAWRAVPAAPERIELGTVDAGARLAARVGKEAVLFGAVKRVHGEGPPFLLWLSDREGADVPAVVFDEAVWKALDQAALARRFVTVRGTVSLYRGRPQVEVAKADQVSTK